MRTCFLWRLEKVYCGSIGAEYMHLHDLDQVNWIRQKLETPGALELDKDEKRLLLARFVISSRSDSRALEL
jgi:2-oxoglutarate dehydrogenase E1 component